MEHNMGETIYDSEPIRKSRNKNNKVQNNLRLLLEQFVHVFTEQFLCDK